jgi:hypothetical protein
LQPLLRLITQIALALNMSSQLLLRLIAQAAPALNTLLKRMKA